MVYCVTCLVNFKGGRFSRIGWIFADLRQGELAMDWHRLLWVVRLVLFMYYISSIVSMPNRSRDFFNVVLNASTRANLKGSSLLPKTGQAW